MIPDKNVFHNEGGKDRYAVSDISFSIERGKIFGFLGPSGAGKFTVRNLMAGLRPRLKGEVLYGGRSVKTLRTRFFNQIGVSFEQPKVATPSMEDGEILSKADELILVLREGTAEKRPIWPGEPEASR